MIIDAHLDLAYSHWALGRDATLSAHDQRTREQLARPEQREEICTVGLPDLVRGGVRLIFGSIFTETAAAGSNRPGFVYETAQEAEEQGLFQAAYYQRLAECGDCLLIRSKNDLAALSEAQRNRPTVGLLVEMEGADPITSPAKLALWRQHGVRQVGPAWALGSRYCGGNRRPGPLTSAGADLLREMDAAGLILDVSHLAEESFWQALRIFKGPVVASHANCRSLVPGERQLSDDMIRAICERGGVIGVVLYNQFLKAGWTLQQGKDAVTLHDVVRHIDHVRHVAGSTAHSGIGSDLDGGFGREATPAEIDTVADLRLLGPALAVAGYSEADIVGILGGNWLRLLEDALPRAS